MHGERLQGVTGGGQSSGKARSGGRRFALVVTLLVLVATSTVASAGRRDATTRAPDLQTLATGLAHTCAIVNSEVRCWGKGVPGTAGDIDTPTGAPPVDIGGRAKSVTSGLTRTCALRGNGSVYCWDYAADPRRVELGGPAIQIGSGRNHDCALLADGTVRCWGSGEYGQLGYGNTNDVGLLEADAAGPVRLARKAVAIAVGGDHSCALLDDGAIRCWGRNHKGQLGNGGIDLIGDDEVPQSDTLNVLEYGPRNEQNDARAVGITAGNVHTCAILVDRRTWCWGDQTSGRLGYTNGIYSTAEPREYVRLGGRTIAVSAGARHTCAVRSDGRLVCWGESDHGRLGNGNAAAGDVNPENVSDPDRLVTELGAGREAVEVSAGVHHTCARVDNGDILCWGSNNDGQLGYGDVGLIGNDETPASVGPVDLGDRAPEVTSLSVGILHTCAVADGDVHCWGAGDGGRLGYGNTRGVGDNEHPYQAGRVKLGREAVAVGAGARHSCALLDNGRVRCWGRNNYGQLGYPNRGAVGDNEDPASVGPVELGRRVVALSVGAYSNCALLDNGRVRCWGDGQQGRLGYGHSRRIGDDEHPRSVPALELGDRAVAIAAGARHACAALAEGQLRCWGDNSTGQLGLGHTRLIGDDEDPADARIANVAEDTGGLGSPSSDPDDEEFARALGLTIWGRVVSIGIGNSWEAYHTCATVSSGHVRCWGRGRDAVLGLQGTYSGSVGDDEDEGGYNHVSVGRPARHVSAGARHSCALRDNGQVNCWGTIAAGRLGYAGELDDRYTDVRDVGNISTIGRPGLVGDIEAPSEVGTLRLGARAKMIDAGHAHTCALLVDGAVRCWGRGGSGRLGYGNMRTIGDNEHPDSIGPVRLLPHGEDGTSSSVVGGLVDHQRISVELEQGFDEMPMVFGAMQTANGTDAAYPRIDNVSTGGYEVWIEEELSFDSERVHVGEKVGHFPLGEGDIRDRDGNIIGEAGRVRQDQPYASHWRVLELQRTYNNPVVLMMLNSANGPDPAHMRIKDVQGTDSGTSTGGGRFSYQIEEWDYLQSKNDGQHTAEDIVYMVVEAGAHVLASGQTLKAHLVELDHSWSDVAFADVFDAVPVVFSQSQTHNGEQSAVTRQRDIDRAGVQLRLQEQELHEVQQPYHVPETVGVIAVD